MNVLAIIPARAGSKRLPGKNMLPLCGKPLVQWTIEAAEAAGLLAIVSSDDDAAIELADMGYGLRVTSVRRPPHLCDDDAPSAGLVAHVLASGVVGRHEHDTIMLLQPTSPLRTSPFIEAALGVLRCSGGPAVLSVDETTGKPNGAIYAVRTYAWEKWLSLEPPGWVPYPMSRERSIDIDTAEDFAAAEDYMRTHGWDR